MTANLPQELFWDVHGLRLAGLSWGDPTNPPLLALHGWLDNAASFSLLAPLLNSYHVVALDLTGHGRSSHRSGDATYQIWDDLPEIIGVLEQLEWQQFYLLGHSRGAIISEILACAIPERVRRLVLLDGVGTLGVAEDKFATQMRKFLDDKQQLMSRDLRVFDTQELAIQQRLKRGDLTSEAAHLICLRNLQKKGDGYSWTTDPRLKGASAVKLTPGHMEAVWCGLSMPALLLLAESGRDGHLEYAEMAAQHIPDLLMESCSGRHHFHMEDGVAAVAGRIDKFLQESRP
jgi:pimeloyl-ACP methyl ester carboxylesterase